jgi:DNA-binding response OmpR family regulator
MIGRSRYGATMARVLIVDDDPDIRGLVVRRIQQAGHQALGANDAGEALEIVDDKGRPDVVVLDVNMPGTDGLSLLGMLREREGLANLPAVFLSGKIEPKDIEAGRALGARYLTKPFVSSALLTAIEAVLEEAASQSKEQGW